MSGTKIVVIIFAFVLLDSCACSRNNSQKEAPVANAPVTNDVEHTGTNGPHPPKASETTATPRQPSLTNDQQAPKAAARAPESPEGEPDYDPLHDVNLKNLGLDPTVVLRIVVHADGLIFFNGTPTKLQDIPKTLDLFKQKKGVVWFYRANPESELQGNAMEVMKMVFSNGQPFIKFTKEDFSEATFGDGSARVKVKTQ